MSDLEKIYVLDDGSLGSKFLQYETKGKYDVEVIKVDGDDIVEWFTKLKPNKKVYLHFTYEKFAENNEKLRREITRLEALGFKNLIVLPYEGMDEKTLIYRAADAKLTKTPDQIAAEKEDIKLTGKPTAIAIDEPDVPEGLDDNDNFIARRDTNEEDKPYYSKFRKKSV